MKTIIIEDVPDELELLKNLLAKYCPKIEVVGHTSKIDEAIELIERLQPELLFLDVEIMEGVTSFNLLDELQKRNIPFGFEVIFMTGHQRFDYATKAFSYSALDFLSKTIDPVHLVRAVDKALERANPQQYVQQLQLFMELIKSSDEINSRMAVNLVGGKIEFIEISTINYLEADGVITFFYFTDRTTTLKAARNLGHYVKILERNKNFISISNNALINYKELYRYDHSEKLVILKDGTRLYASRRDGQELNSRIKTNPMNNEGKLSLLSALFRRLLGK